MHCRHLWPILEILLKQALAVMFPQQTTPRTSSTFCPKVFQGGYSGGFITIQEYFGIQRPTVTKGIIIPDFAPRASPPSIREVARKQAPKL